MQCNFAQVVVCTTTHMQVHPFCCLHSQTYSIWYILYSPAAMHSCAHIHSIKIALCSLHTLGGHLMEPRDGQYGCNNMLSFSITAKEHHWSDGLENPLWPMLKITIFCEVCLGDGLYLQYTNNNFVSREDSHNTW